MLDLSLVSSSSGSHCLFNHRLLEGLSDSSPAGSRRWSCSLPLVHWSVWPFLWLVLFSSVGTLVCLAFSVVGPVLFRWYIGLSGLFCGWSCSLPLVHWSVWPFLWLVLFSSVGTLVCLAFSVVGPVLFRWYIGLSGLFCGWSCSLHWYLGLVFSVAGLVLFIGTSIWPFVWLVLFSSVGTLVCLAIPCGWSCSLHWYLDLAFLWLVPYTFFLRYIGLTFFSGCTSIGKSVWLFCLFACFCFYMAGTRFPFVLFSCLLLVIYSVVYLFRPCFCSFLLCLFLSFRFFFLSDVCVSLFYFRKIRQAILLLSVPACFCN